MDPLQTTYLSENLAGFPGMIANAPSVNGPSKAASETIPFGRLVVLDGLNSVKLPDVAADVTNLAYGFAIADTSRQSTAGDASYTQYEAVSIMQEGTMFIETIDAAPLNGLVYIVVGAGANQGKAASTSGGGTLLKGARFAGPVLAAPGLCKVVFNVLGN